jgi:hypothetical protein
MALFKLLNFPVSPTIKLAGHTLCHRILARNIALGAIYKSHSGLWFLIPGFAASCVLVVFLNHLSKSICGDGNLALFYPACLSYRKGTIF